MSLRRTTLLFAIALVLTTSLVPQPAHAQVESIAGGAIGGIAGCAVGSLLSSVSFDKVPVTDSKQSEQTTKECVLDGILVGVRQGIIEEITADIVSWINSGFEGNPAFVTDFEGFMRNVADRTAGEFIRSSDLGVLCSPVDIRIGLALSYYSSFEEKNQCTLSDIVSNTKNFIDGNFSEGGWRGWTELSVRPHNNPYGSFLSAQGELQARVSSEVNKEQTYLEFGGGFRSKESCTQTTSEDGTTQENCYVNTPGTVINQQLNEQLGSGMRQMELADEIDEIVSALMAQLVKETLTSSGGLLGTTEPGGDEGDSYIDDINQIDEQRTEEMREDVEEQVTAQFDAQRDVEDRYITEQEGMLSSAEEAKERFEEVVACYEKHLAHDEQTEGGTNEGHLTDSQEATAHSRIESAKNTIDSEIQPVIDSRSENISTATGTLAAIDDVESDFQEDLATSTSSSELNQVLNTYSQFQNLLPADTVLHTSEDVSTAQRQNSDTEDIQENTIKENMNDLEEEASNMLETCQEEFAGGLPDEDSSR